MKIIIILGYLTNLTILSFFYMHMFQLNSYYFIKQINWTKENSKKIIFQNLIMLIVTILAMIDNIVCNILSAMFLGFSIFYNLPKGNSKIEFKITNRVKRMIITQLILIILVLLINDKNYIFIKLGILNILAPILCIIANLINCPIEYIRRKHYIKEAKKILSNMPELIVIGVTGSYGKTSVKSFLEKMLEKKYEVLTTPQNYNTTMGVVKTIRENLKPTHQIFICEMGATKQGDIKEICDIVNPKFGIITSIGPQHLESFKNIDNIIKTKFELADSVKQNNGTIFINNDNDYLYNYYIEQDCIKYGINDTNLDYSAFNIKSSSQGSSFSIIDKNTNEETQFKTKIIGTHNVVNIVGAIAISNHLGIQLRELVALVKNIKSVKHRLELLQNNNINIIDDSYNSNPISSKFALDTLAQFEGKKIIVTPGLIELGKDEEKYNFELGKYASKTCDYIFLVNSKPSKHVLKGILKSNFNKNKLFQVNSPNEAMQKILNLKIKGKITVLLENDLPDNYNI